MTQARVGTGSPVDLTAGSRDSLAGCSWLSLCAVVYNYTLAFLVTIALYFFYGKGHKTTRVIITLLAWQIEEDRCIFLFGVL